MLSPIGVVVRQIMRSHLTGACADDPILPLSPTRFERIRLAVRARGNGVVSPDNLVERRRPKKRASASQLP
jgi:hypothetical protein